MYHYLNKKDLAAKGERIFLCRIVPHSTKELYTYPNYYKLHDLKLCEACVLLHALNSTNTFNPKCIFK